LRIADCGLSEGRPSLAVRALLGKPAVAPGGLSDGRPSLGLRALLDEPAVAPGDCLPEA
jgi:hypothetical protein